MSLKVWLPLNGNLENKGISDTVMIGAPASWDTNGKIGKCATFTGSVNNVIYNNTTDYNFTDNFSWAIWIKTNYTGTATQYIFTNGRADAGKYGYGLQCIGVEWCRCRFGNQSYDIPVNSGEWTHLTFTKSGTNIKIYKNGALIVDTVFSGTLPTYTDGNGLGLGCFHYSNNIYPYYGSINDFRIYDHCLSQKEVKEISQGLILHYKLDKDPKTINGIRNYLGNGYPFFDKPEKTDYTRSHLRAYSFYRSDSTVLSSDAGLNLVVDPNGVKCREIIFSATRDNTISYLYQLQHRWKYSGHEEFENNFNIWNDFQVGDYLTLSFEVWGDNYFKIGANDMDTHAVILNAKVADSSTENLQFIPSAMLFSNSEDLNKWHKISGTVQMTQDFYDYIHSADLTKFGFVFNISSIENVSIANQPITVRLRKLMLEKSDIAHEWTPAPEDLDIDTAKIPDSSGYGNDGTVVGNIFFLMDSSRYNISAYMNNSGTANHIEYNALETSGAYTISFWIKAALSKNQVIFADNNHGYEFGILNNLFYTSTTSNKGWSTSKFITNNWNHIVIISQDGIESNVKLFVNGVEETSRTGASNWYSHNKTNPWLLNRGNNNTYAADASLSDFRIYATALSAEDIATLYHTSAQIDNLQNIHAFEFKENDNRTSVYQNGIMSAIDEIYESNSILLNTVTSGGYTPTKDASNSCTSFGYVNFEDYVPSGQDLSVHIECDVEWTAFTAGTGGTFKGVWFQGATYEISSSTYKWIAGTNYITTALNSSYSLQDTTLLSTSGSHHYDVITIIPSSWFLTYSRLNMGFRCDYSDGTGTINIKNFKVTPLKYYNAKVGEDFISANNFIEK